MSYDDYDDPPDGSCQDCGEPTAEDYHRFCSSCYRRQMGWDNDNGDGESWRQPRPEPGTPPESFVAGLTEVRAKLELLIGRLSERFEEIDQQFNALDERIARLEHERTVA